jgi:hypothetical protein
VDTSGSQNIAITQYMGHVAPKTLELFIETAINAVTDPIPRHFLYFNVPILTIISGVLKDLENMRTAVEGLNLDSKNYQHGIAQWASTKKNKSSQEIFGLMVQIYPSSCHYY